MTQNQQGKETLRFTILSNDPDVVRDVRNIDLNELKCGKKLGQGSYGSVYQGKWANRTVAVKQIWPDDQKSFDIEVKQLTRIIHDNIVEIFATAVDDSWRYIIMEYAAGGSLDTFLHSDFKPIYSEAQGLGWALNCVQGLDYLHRMKPRPLLHRDLKPANLLLTRHYDSVKIADFGLVAELKQKMSGDKGTEAYMAPEVFACIEYNAKCDVYSFGIVLWEIRSRQKPFEGVAVIPWQTKNGVRPPDIKNCPPMISKLMKRCWDPNPAERPTALEASIEINSWGRVQRRFDTSYARELFPKITCFGWDQIENPHSIDWDFGTNVYKGKIGCKEVFGMEFLGVNPTKSYIWLQQYLSLSHFNVISILGIAVDPLVAIIDCADLISLHRFLHGEVKVEYSLNNSLCWVRDCAEGMEYLYSLTPSPFIRCALNPTNLLLTLQGLLKIGNLEIFSTTLHDTANIAYEAPEILEGKPFIEKSDVYSWAIVFWEILTRQKPFDGHDIDEISSQTIAGKRPALRADWNNSIKQILQECWDRDLTIRPTMKIVAERMNTFDIPPVSAIALKGLTFQMGDYYIRPLNTLIPTEDLEKILQPIPLLKVGNERVYRKLNGRFEYCIWKGQKILTLKLLREFRESLYSWGFSLNIRHPNIVNLVGLTRAKNLVAEYSENGHLYTFLHGDNKKEYTRAHAFSWAQQFAEGWTYLLNKNAPLFPSTTLDLLLSNKCLTLKIIPLPLFYSRPNNFAPAYFPSEYLCGTGLNEKVLVYSWAIVMWEILTRKKPFEGYSKQTTEQKVKDGERPAISEDWPTSIKLLMNNCWNTYPEKRPKMQEVVDSMRQLVVDIKEEPKPIEHGVDSCSKSSPKLISRFINF